MCVCVLLVCPYQVSIIFVVVVNVGKAINNGSKKKSCTLYLTSLPFVTTHFDENVFLTRCNECRSQTHTTNITINLFELSQGSTVRQDPKSHTKPLTIHFYHIPIPMWRTHCRPVFFTEASASTSKSNIHFIWNSVDFSTNNEYESIVFFFRLKFYMENSWYDTHLQQKPLLHADTHRAPRGIHAQISSELSLEFQYICQDICIATEIHTMECHVSGKGNGMKCTAWKRKRVNDTVENAKWFHCKC